VKIARQHGTLSHELSDVSRLALRAGRRAHAETGIDAAGQSLVSLGLGLGASACGSQPGLVGLSVLVIGAGSMSSLAVATAVRQGASRVVIANRTPGRAERLAARYGAGTTSLADLPAAVAAADLVVACTGAAGHVLGAETVSQALRMRDETTASGGGPGRGKLALVDLALPRDVEAAAGALPGVRLIDLETIGAASGRHAPGAARLAALASESDVTAVRRIVAEELAGYLRAQRAESVAPTVVALRAKAATVVESELARLERRLGELDARTRGEIAQTMGRIADKLLHGPTVRVKELADAPGADSYEAALRVLFELDPEAVHAVARPDDDWLAWLDQEAGQ